jgi:exodeoxyribonuclease VII large subunit
MSKTVLSVSELNLSAQRLLEGHFSSVWVEGEISNLSKPSSGHVYFTLKDDKAQIRCALFRMRVVKQKLDLDTLRNGLLIQAEAKVSIYPDRGDYQLIVDSVEMAGDGLLRKAYEELVKKLALEGLFQEKWKKKLPAFPKHIGVITSPTGAAIRDILSVLKRRYPLAAVTLYPSKVQGADAAPELVQALALAEQHQAADVIILARGGGSLEDLWPFNEEIVARAIFACGIPIVSGVGHEIDFSIADLVADRRAATPSAAAELVSPSQQALLEQYKAMETYLQNLTLKFLQNMAQKLDWLNKRLRHPGTQITLQLERLKNLQIRLNQVIERFLKDKRIDLQQHVRHLDNMSPLATLARGYAIVSHKDKIIRSVKDVSKGDILTVRLTDGVLEAVH